MLKSLGQLHQRGLLPLVPLVLLTIFSYMHGRAHLYTTLTGESDPFMILARCLLPGLFALTLALLLPSRPKWFLSALVSVNYLWLLLLVLVYAADRFNYPTLCVIAALGSAPLVRPRKDSCAIPEGAFILQRLPAFVLVPALILAGAMALAGLVDNVFISYFLKIHDSAWCSLISPFNILIRATGLNSTLQPVYMLRGQDIHSVAAMNAIMLSEALILPAIILTKAAFCRAPFKMLLSVLGFIALITSHIGECVSLSFALLLVFFTGSFVAALLSSVAVYCLCLYLNLQLLSDLHLFYHPDLINWNLHLARLPPGALTALLAAVAIPALLLSAAHFLGRFLHKYSHQRNQEAVLGYRVTHDSPPDVCALALLRAIGGIGNLENLSREGTKLLLRLGDPDKIVRQSLNALCVRSPSFDKDYGLLICDLGAGSHNVAGRINRMLEALSPWPLKQADLSQPYIIERGGPTNAAEALNGSR